MMKKIPYLMFALLALKADAQWHMGLSAGATVYYAKRGNLSSAARPQSDLSPAYALHAAYELKHYLQPMLMISRTSMNTSNAFDRINRSIMVGSRGAFLKSALSPVYQLGIGYAYAKITDIPDFQVPIARTSAPVYTYGLGAKYSISQALDVHLLIADHISGDRIIIGDQKYRYVTATAGVIWKAGKN